MLDVQDYVRYTESTENCTFKRGDCDAGRELYEST